MTIALGISAVLIPLSLQNFKNLFGLICVDGAIEGVDATFACAGIIVEHSNNAIMKTTSNNDENFLAMLSYLKIYLAVVDEYHNKSSRENTQ